MRHLKTLVPILAIVSALAACGEDAQPGDFRADYRIIVLEGLPEAWSLAYFREGRGPLPDAEDGALTSNGIPMRMHASESRWTFSGDLPRVEPGDTYDFVLEIPGAEPITNSVAMVHPGELTAPAAGTEISIEEDLVVTWSEAIAGETDWVAFRVREPYDFAPYAAEFISVSAGPSELRLTTRAGEGLTTVSVPRDLLRRSYEEAVAARGGSGGPVEPADSPLAVELVLARSRSAPTSPPFQSGTISLFAEVASVPVVLVP